MKKGLRIIALLFAALMVVSALSVAFAAASSKPIADGKTNDNTMFHQSPSSSSPYVKGYMLIHSGTEVYIYDFTDDASWAFIKFGVHEGWVETASLDIVLRKGISVPGLSYDNKGVVVGPNTSYQQQIAAAAAGIGTGVTTGNINFRKGPGTNYAKVSGCSQVPKGATVTVFSSQTTDQLWYKVKYGNYEGYLAGKYLNVTLTPAPAATPAPVSTLSGLFGDPSSQSTDGLWFPGSSGATNTSSSGGLFGNGNKPFGAPNAGSSGSSGNNGSGNSPISGGIFGNNTPNNTANNNAGNNAMFGGTYSSASLFGTPSQSTQQQSSQTTQSCTITANDVNMRSGAGTSFDRLGKLKKNSTGVVHAFVDKNGGWYEVTINGKRGFVHSDYVKVSGGAAAPSAPAATNNNGSLISTAQPSSSATGYAAYTGTSADIWGTISVPNTHINASIYCNALDKKGAFVYNAYSAKYNNIYALNYVGNQVSVIYGHNMRKAAKNNIFTPTSSNGGPGLHELHHIQNAWLGKAKCELCGKSCADAKTDVFNINYNGASRWQLVGFFELNSKTMSSSSTRKSVQKFASFPGQAADWAKTMMGYCTSKYYGATLGNFNASDKMMVIITCGDSSGNNNQSLYMLLRAIG